MAGSAEGLGVPSSAVARVAATNRELQAQVDEVTAALRDGGVEIQSDREGPATSTVLILDGLQPNTEHVIGMAAECDRGHLLVLIPATHALAHGEAWRLLDLGASDVLVWRGRATAQCAALRIRRWHEIDTLLDSVDVTGVMVGRSRALRTALGRMVEIARFSTSSLLITGETGTGKELVAGLVHRLDTRPDKGPFVVVDCTTVVPALSGSEFFGHEKGAFTGAVAPREGAFALANKGTLFLDEVGDLPLPLQAELLRVTQEGVYKRLGSNTWRSTRFRLISATHRDLVAEARAGAFRRDLYYRIAAATVRLPSLSERAEDILVLFRHFLDELRPDGEPATLEPDVAELLQARPYPGNVRDLRQLAQQIHLRHVGPGPITVGDLPEEERPIEPDVPTPPSVNGDLVAVVRYALAHGMNLTELRNTTVDTAVRVALEDTGGHVHQAAQLLGVSDRAVQQRRASARAAAMSAQGPPRDKPG